MSVIRRRQGEKYSDVVGSRHWASYLHLKEYEEESPEQLPLGNDILAETEGAEKIQGQ